MAVILSGKETAQELQEVLKQSCGQLQQRGIIPTLELIRVGGNAGDLAYERAALKRCNSLGIHTVTKAFSSDAAEEEVIEELHAANSDETVDGVLMLRPLPRHMDSEKVENILLPSKDVDGMTAASLAAVFLNRGHSDGFAPCTAQACIEILDHYGYQIAGKRAVVIGRSPVIGKPVAMMLLARNATVTICHTKTENLPEIARDADILVAAAGCAGMITKEFVKEGSIIIDVGINTDAEGKLTGDVLYDEVFPIAQAVTPVPGGVGSVTTTVLAKHVIEAAMQKKQKNL